MSAEQFSRTVEKLYAAAADASLWREALHDIEELTGSVGAVLGMVPRRTGDPGFNLAGRFTIEQCAEYTASYMMMCRRTSFMISRPDVGIYYDSLLITEAEMDRDPVYGWFASHGLRYYVGCTLPATPYYAPIFSLQRSPKQGHVQSKDIELFSMLKPHLAQAVSLAEILGTFSAASRFHADVLNSLPQGHFALDECGRLLFANEPAQLLLRHADGLTLNEDRLVTRIGAYQVSLDGLIAAAAHQKGSERGGWLRLPRPSGRLPYVVFVSPLSVGHLPEMITTPKVLVVVHDPEKRQGPDHGALRQLYGLTQTEARLASAIAIGHSVESAAVSMQMRVSTARSHLKDIFRKVEVNRQQDLVRVLGQLR